MLSGLGAALSIKEMTTPTSNVDNLVQVDANGEDALETQMASLSADAAQSNPDAISVYPTLA